MVIDTYQRLREKGTSWAGPSHLILVLTIVPLIGVPGMLMNICGSVCYWGCSVLGLV